MSTSVVRVRGASAAVLAVALLTAGCSGGSDPATSSTSKRPTSSSTSSSPSSSSSSSPSATSSTTSAAPVDLPAAAKAHTTKGAEAFARYYTESIGHGLLTADSGTLQALSSPDCVACQGLIELVDGYKRKQQHADKQAMAVGYTKVDPRSTRDRVIVDVLADDAAYNIVRDDGTKVAAVKGEKFDLRYTVAWRANRWVVVDSKQVVA